MNTTKDKKINNCPKRAGVYIDRNIIRSNIDAIKTHVSGSKVMAVVKADGYGHGLIQVAEICEEKNIDYLGVAILEEGIELRKADIKTPVLVFGHIPINQIDYCIENNLEITLFSLEQALEIEKYCKARNYYIKAQINIDTGMNRIGFSSGVKEILLDMAEIAKLSHIKITGIYTHFAESDAEDKEFSKQQANQFLDIVNSAHMFEDRPIIHASNSGAIASLKEYNFDMVRAGLILYGLSPSKYVDIKSLGIKPVLSFKSYVAFIKTINAGESVGYGRNYFATRKTVVATIPLGYADGYSRSLSNKANVLINGVFYVDDSR